MRKILLLFAFFSSTLFGFDLETIDPLFDGGAHGAFVGATQDVCIIAGGTQDQAKISRITVIEKTKFGKTRKYQRADMFLPIPTAFGASISTSEGLICLGGENDTTCLNDVYMIKWNKEQKHIEFISLPPLPFPLAHASGAQLGNRLFIVGGVFDIAKQKPNRYLLELNLSALSSSNWTIRSCLPGPARLDPGVATQSNGLRETLYIMGGQDPETKVPLDDAYLFDEQIERWDAFGPIPFPSINISAAASGANHIYVNGDRLLAYHTITKTWTEMSRVTEEKLQNRKLTTHKDVTYFGPSEDDSTLFVHKATTSYAFGKVNTLILASYLVILVGMGLYFSSRKKQTSLEYFKADYKIPWWAAGLSILGTEISALNFLSVPAKSFASDWQYLVMDMTLILVIPVIIYGFLPFFRRLQVTTAYEYLENRFNLSVRILSSSIYIIFELLRIGLVLYLPAIALSFITGWSVPLCIVTMGGLSVLYTALGGIEAVIWSDVLQVLVLLFAAFFAIGFLIYDSQMSVSNIYNLAFEHEKLKIFDFALDFRRPTFWVLLFSSMSYDIMDYGADQTTVQRYLTVKDEKAAQKSIWLNVILCLILGLIFYALGSLLYVYFRKFPEMMDTSMQLSDNIFAHYIIYRLPVGVSGIVITGIFAAAMSTLDSSLNAVATTITNDFFTRLGSKKSDQAIVRIAKLTTLFIGALGTGYALFLTQFKIISFLDYYDIAVAYTLCTVSGIFLLGVFTKRANSQGVITGAILSIAFVYGFHKFTNLHFLLLMPLSTVTTFMLGYLASLRTSAKDVETDPFTAYSKKS